MIGYIAFLESTLRNNLALLFYSFFLSFFFFFFFFFLFTSFLIKYLFHFSSLLLFLAHSLSVYSFTIFTLPLSILFSFGLRDLKDLLTSLLLTLNSLSFSFSCSLSCSFSCSLSICDCAILPFSLFSFFSPKVYYNNTRLTLFSSFSLCLPLIYSLFPLVLPILSFSPLPFVCVYI